jgi:hypothetical protein
MIISQNFGFGYHWNEGAAFCPDQAFSFLPVGSMVGARSLIDRFNMLL